MTNLFNITFLKRVAKRQNTCLQPNLVIPDTVNPDKPNFFIIQLAHGSQTQQVKENFKPEFESSAVFSSTLMSSD